MGEPISIYYSVNAIGPWTLIGTGNTDPTGMYTVSWSPPANGTYYFRADFSGDSNYSTSTTTSAPNSMIVIPELPMALVTVIAALALGTLQVMVRRIKKRT
jgi:hypothetical protein